MTINYLIYYQIKMELEYVKDQILNIYNKILAFEILNSGDFIVSTYNKLLLFDTNFVLKNQIDTDEQNVIYSICIKNQQKFYTGNNIGIIQEWEEDKYKNIYSKHKYNFYKAHNSEITQILIINNYIYSCSTDYTIKVRKINQLDETLCEIKESGPIISIIYDIESKLLVSAGENGIIFYLDLDNIDVPNLSQFYQYPKNFNYYKNSIKFFEKNDEKISIIVGGDNSIKIYSLDKTQFKEDSQIIPKINIIDINYSCSAIYVFESNKKTIFITGESNLDTNDENIKIRIYINHKEDIMGEYHHTKTIKGFIPYPDNTVASYSDDGKIKFWKLKLN